MAFRELLDKLSLTADQVAYIGDDLIDWPVMAQVGGGRGGGRTSAVDAARHYVTRIAGGRGAVRELCDIILLAQNKLEDAKGLSI